MNTYNIRELLKHMTDDDSAFIFTSNHNRDVEVFDNKTTVSYIRGDILFEKSNGDRFLINSSHITKIAIKRGI